MKVLKKIVKIVIIVILALLVLWGVANLAKFIIYPDYMQNREKVCAIPELSDGFVPQGISYDAESGEYLMSGYMGEGVAVYTVSEKSYKKVELFDFEGKPFEGHGGGITVAGDYAYVADGSCLTAFYLDDIRNSDTATAVKVFSVDNAASYVFSDENYIYVGEFFREGDYEIDASHSYVTPEGEEYRAIVSVYPIDEHGNVTSETPDYSIAVPSLVQGIAVKDGVIAISRSWGLSTSKLEFYNGAENAGATISVFGKEVPLLYVGEKNLIKSVDAPFFSEDLTVVGDRIIINFESACNKYIIGKLFFATYATSYPIPKI